MKTFLLLSPDYSALDSIWRNALPFSLWPVGPQPLLAHWMDESVRTGAASVTIYASDRPSEIRHFLEGGNYWSKKVEVIALKNDGMAPEGCVRMDHLPFQASIESPFSSPQALLDHWLALQHAWLANRGAEGVSIDIEKVPGGWVGPLARIHPSAKLIPPFWIGARAEIGAECEIGPNALVGSGSVLDRHVMVRDAIVMPDTYLGQNTGVEAAIAQGGILVDAKHACRVDIRESFIMASVSTHRQSTSITEKAGALTALVFLAPIAALWPGQSWDEREVINHKGDILLLSTGRKGPLVIRRWPWLKEVVSGNLRWFGILPRLEADWAHLPLETAERLRSSPPGLFSWADLQGCHDPSCPDEWIHAAYQVLQKDDTIMRLLRSRLTYLARLNPRVAEA